jgi:hypothetical protein
LAARKIRALNFFVLFLGRFRSSSSEHEELRKIAEELCANEDKFFMHVVSLATR